MTSRPYTHVCDSCGHVIAEHRLTPDAVDATGPYACRVCAGEAQVCLYTPGDPMTPISKAEYQARQAQGLDTPRLLHRPRWRSLTLGRCAPVSVVSPGSSGVSNGYASQLPTTTATSAVPPTGTIRASPTAPVPTLSAGSR